MQKLIHILFEAILIFAATPIALIVALALAGPWVDASFLTIPHATLGESFLALLGFVMLCAFLFGVAVFHFRILRNEFRQAPQTGVHPVRIVRRVFLGGMLLLYGLGGLLVLLAALLFSLETSLDFLAGLF